MDNEEASHLHSRDDGFAALLGKSANPTRTRLAGSALPGHPTLGFGSDRPICVHSAS